MSKQLVELTYITPLWVIAKGIRYSHDNHHLSDTEKNKADYLLAKNLRDEKIDVIELEHYIGTKDYDLIKRVGFKYKHSSTLEHSLIVYDIECSRALLQELSRHRLQSLTVKSSRYTLKELLEIPKENIDNIEVFDRFLILTNNEAINNYNRQQLRALYEAYNKHYVKTNDIAKYALPEAFRTSLQLSLNLRSLLNLLKLRLSKDALWEFRELAKEMFEVLPGDYKQLILEDEDIKKELEGMK
jgi:thymidylate synthase (FAD)